MQAEVVVDRRHPLDSKGSAADDDGCGLNVELSGNRVDRAANHKVLGDGGGEVDRGGLDAKDR